MKILAKFLLPSVFVFLPAVVYAQGPYCGLAPIQEAALANEITEMGRGRADVFVYLDVFGDLEDGQNCLNNNLTDLKDKVEESVKFEKTFVWPTITDNANDILDLQKKLKQTESDLHIAETKIETLEDRLRIAEEALQELQHSVWMPHHPVSNPKATVNKPKVPVNIPTPVKPKPPTSKPTAPVNKPAPQ